MNEIFMVFYYIILFIFGAVLGSFACCQAWRIRYANQKKKDLGKRSVCLSCGRQLSWRDNIPVISWLALKGKCRKCGAKIGAAEILAELGTGAAFALIGWRFIDSTEVWQWVLMVGILALFVAFVVLFVYDAKWKELPVNVLIISNVLAAVVMGVRIWGVIASTGSFIWSDVANIVVGVALLAGMYYLLYKFSGEKLVGGGDWILCLAISMALSSWWLSLIALFVSNALGSIIMLPVVSKEKKKKKGAVQIPFGPFLILAFLIVVVFETFLMSLGVDTVLF